MPMSKQRWIFRGCDPCELGQEKYVTRIVERLMTAIQPDETKGEIPLLPILNRYAADRYIC